MSRNMGRQAHRTQQSTHHLKLDNKIADLKSDLNSSTQKAKEIKAQLKELTVQKKEAGKSPRKTQTSINHFNFPIPKIEGITRRMVTMMAPDENPSEHIEASTSSELVEHRPDDYNGNYGLFDQIQVQHDIDLEMAPPVVSNPYGK